MIIKIFILLTLLLRPLPLLAESGQITITEIGAHEKSNYEWIEIYNGGAEAVDLSDWKFFEDETNHGISEFQGGMVLEADSYAVIADVAENFLENRPGWEGVLLDSSWSTLNLAGEEIGLKNSLGEIVELFIYPGVGETSLQKTELLADPKGDVWLSHPDSDTAGLENVFEVGEGESEEVVEETEEAGESTEEWVNYMVGSLVINELMPNPAKGKEWVEIYNNNDSSVDLENWKLIDGAGRSVILEGEITSEGFATFDVGTNLLNNLGDALYLRDKNGNMVDYVVYGDWNDDNYADNNAPAPKKGQSLARYVDGGFTNNNAADFSLTDTPTKNSPNEITLPDEPDDGESYESDSASDKKEKISVTPKPPKPKIRINELFPNPIGSDRFYEFIELFNEGAAAVDLEGWQLENKAGQRFVMPAVELAPGGHYVLSRAETGLALNNSGDDVRLYNQSGKQTDRVRYRYHIDENHSYQLIEGSWVETTQPTKGVVNAWPNRAPVIVAECQKSNDGSMICDASDTYDFDNDLLIFSWVVTGGSNGEKIYDGDYVRIPVADGVAVSVVVSDSFYKVDKDVVKAKKGSSKNAETESENSKEKDRSEDSAGPYKLVSLSDLADLPLRKDVEVTESVTVPSDSFAIRTFYIGDPAVEVYLSSGSLPKLRVDQSVKVTGKTSVSSGKSRILISSPNDIEVIGKAAGSVPMSISSIEISSVAEGSVVKVTGEVVGALRHIITLSDDAGETEIYLKKNTGLTQDNLPVGELLEVSGVVMTINDKQYLLPRSADDIKTAVVVSDNEKGDETINTVVGSIDDEISSKPSEPIVIEAEAESRLPAVLVAIGIVILALIILLRIPTVGQPRSFRKDAGRARNAVKNLATRMRDKVSGTGIRLNNLSKEYDKGQGNA